MSLVFQYGSNTSFHRLNSSERLNGAAKIVTPAYTVEYFELDFTVWSNHNKCAAADIVPNGITRIWGVIYEIPDTLIYRELSGSNRSLDSIEGEGTNYQRTNINVISKFDTKITSVLTYVVRERKNGLITSVEYASEIINGLKSHDIPREYLAYVYERILLNNSKLRGLLPSIDH
jgi:hypothetical protein